MTEDAAPEPQYADPERYAELTGFGSEWRDLFWNADFLRLMAARWRLSEVSEALDVGCGAGHWSRTVLGLLPPSATMIGLDHQPEFLPMAQQGAARRGQQDRFSCVEGSVDALPFEDNRFDLVTCQLVLIHVGDVEAALREMLRVTRPGGLVAVVEPDNRAGNLALLGGSGLLDDEQIAAMVRFFLVTERGKRALGEGDNSVGSRIPGLLRGLGASEVSVFTNDRCMDLAPPYEAPDMKRALEQELPWAQQGVSTLVGTRSDAERLFVAGGGDPGQFDEHWALAQTVMDRFREGIAAGTYHAARGFVLYLTGARKPG